MLTLAIFLPLIGAIVVALIPGTQIKLIRQVATLVTIATFIPLLLLTWNYARGGGESAVETLKAEVQEALNAAPDGSRAEIEALLVDAKANHPGLVEFEAADAGNPNEEEQAKLAIRARLEGLKGAGAYDAYHTAWELTLAQEATAVEDLRYVSHASWISLFNINYFVGVDGLSLPLMFLTGLLWVLCFIFSFTMEKGIKAYFVLFLILETGLLGVFSSLDFFLFYVFWEVVLLPMYFLIGIWGGPRRMYAAIKFFIYTLVGSVLMLVAMLALYLNEGCDTFNLLALNGMSGGFSATFQMWLFWAMFVGFAIKVPVFPFHTWLPDAHVQAPTAVSVVLAGVLLKMGGYGFFRFLFMLTPNAMGTDWVITTLGVLGMINIVYGALCAMAQKDFKSLVAYSSVSHMGFVLLGMAAMTQAGIQGAVLQMFNHGVSSAMMFLLVGVIYERAHHRDLNRFGGVALQMPYYTGFAVVGFFASLGLPGLNGFISEALTFMGSFDSQEFFASRGMHGLPRWIVYLALPGVVLTAGYILWTVQRVYLGEPKDEKIKTFKDLSFREVFVLTPLALMCIILGVWPSVLIDYIDSTIDHLREFVMTVGMVSGS